MTRHARKHAATIVTGINGHLEGFSPLEVIVLTLAGLIVGNYVLAVLCSVYETGFLTLIFRFATKLPFLRGKVAAEEKKMKDDF